VPKGYKNTWRLLDTARLRLLIARLIFYRLTKALKSINLDLVTRRAAALTRNHQGSARVIRNTDALVQTTDQQVQRLTANRDSAAVEFRGCHKAEP
jgi:hypothetical protein